jgi:hypothetical protein
MLDIGRVSADRRVCLAKASATNETIEKLTEALSCEARLSAASENVTAAQANRPTVVNDAVPGFDGD